MALARMFCVVWTLECVLYPRPPARLPSNACSLSVAALVSIAVRVLCTSALTMISEQSQSPAIFDECLSMNAWFFGLHDV